MNPELSVGLGLQTMQLCHNVWYGVSLSLSYFYLSPFLLWSNRILIVKWRIISLCKQDHNTDRSQRRAKSFEISGNSRSVRVYNKKLQSSTREITNSLV